MGRRLSRQTHRTGEAILGVFSPEGTLETDRQILALDRLFKRQRIDASIVVLGRCQHDLAVMESGRNLRDRRHR